MKSSTSATPGLGIAPVCSDDHNSASQASTSQQATRSAAHDSGSDVPNSRPRWHAATASKSTLVGRGAVPAAKAVSMGAIKSLQAVSSSHAAISVGHCVRNISTVGTQAVAAQF